MKINCIHWQPGSTPGIGMCAAGVKRNPSPGACASCAKREAIEAGSPCILDSAPLPASPSMAQDYLAVVGPLLWAELHGFAASQPELIGAEGAEAIRAWLKAFSKRLPCGDCRGHFEQILAGYPPLLSSRDEFFAWTVEVHNRINARLGHAEFPLQRGRRQHGLEAA